MVAQWQAYQLCSIPSQEAIYTHWWMEANTTTVGINKGYVPSSLINRSTERAFPFRLHCDDVGTETKRKRNGNETKRNGNETKRNETKLYQNQAKPEGNVKSEINF